MNDPVSLNPAYEHASTPPQLVAIEAGGTKFVVAVGTNHEDARVTTIATETPERTLSAVLAFIKEAASTRPIAGIGIASFGPLGVDAASGNYGVIGSTPKPHWSGVNYLKALSTLNAPIVIDTDVNGAALAEALLGVGKGNRRVAYVTIGTGIGIGFTDEGVISNGSRHPEAGHILLPPHPDDPLPGGICPFHKGCLEGLASGPSIHERWGQSLSELIANKAASAEQAIALQAHYLGIMCSNLSLMNAPDVIVLGGGVSQTPGLIDAVRAATLSHLNGYLDDLSKPEAIEHLVQPAALAPHSGLVGAFMLAHRAAQTTH